VATNGGYLLILTVAERAVQVFDSANRTLAFAGTCNYREISHASQKDSSDDSYQTRSPEGTRQRNRQAESAGFEKKDP
jgi:hypothetical protein